MEDFFDRLDKYMKYRCLNDNQMTVTAGLSVGSLGKQRKGSRGLSSDSIAKILHSYADLSAEWLLTGKGEMLRDQKKAIKEPLATEENGQTAAILLKRIEELTIENYKLKQELANLSVEKKIKKSATYTMVAEPELTKK